MTQGQRLFIVTFFPLMGLAMLWILFDTSGAEARPWNTGIGLAAALVSLLAGRAFVTWAQQKGLKSLDEGEAPAGSQSEHSGSKSALYAASGFGVILGPWLLQFVPVDSPLLLFLTAFFAFLSGWGLAPDLVGPARERARRTGGSLGEQVGG